MPIPESLLRRWVLRRSGLVIEGGAALVEFVIVAPLLIVLSFGAVDVGAYLNDVTKLREVVREGGRRAAVGRYGNVLCSSSPGQAESAQYMAGQPRDGETGKLICLAKLLAVNAGLDARVATRVVSFDSSGNVGAGQNEQWSVGNGVLVCAQVQARSRTRLLAPLLDNRVIRSAMVMRITKPLPAGPGEAADAPLTADWSACTVPS